MTGRRTGPALGLLAAVLAVVAVLLGVVSVTGLPGSPDSPGSGTAQAGPASAPSGSRSSGAPTPPPATEPSGERTQRLDVAQDDIAVPVRLRVPRLGIDSAIDRLSTTAAGELQSPPRWQVAGWFASGARPGENGPAVIAGHVDSSSGPAVFARLSQVRPGDAVVVTARDGTSSRFVVDRTTVAPRDGFPTAAVYGPTPDSQLRLITCDGPYVESSGGYQDNLIVFASATSS